MNLPDELSTDRLSLRVPHAADADAIFARYASDADVTRLVGWPRHRSLDDTRAFLAWDADTRASGGGSAYLVFDRRSGALLGSTGLAFEGDRRAMTGYVLARDAWGHGYATEALRAMVALAFGLGPVERLYAITHPSNTASERVLAKAAFSKEGTLRRHTVFPNLTASAAQDVAMWARTS